MIQPTKVVPFHIAEKALKDMAEKDAAALTSLVAEMRAEGAKVDQLRSALERMTWNFRLLLARKPVLEAGEALAEADAALAATAPAAKEEI